MSAFAIIPPFPVFTGIDGEPLDSGKIYVGLANLDPVTNPVALYWDEALTIAATQPIVTSGGYAVRNGTPSSFYAAVAVVSITVKDAVDVVVFTKPEVTDISSYLPNGTGAVRRSIAGKLQETVSVTDFGITTASSAAAQTAAFQDALDYAGSLDSGGVVIVPSGDWTLNSVITVPQNVTLRIDGAKIASSAANAIIVALGTASQSGNIVGSGHNSVIEHTGTGYAISMNGVGESSAHPFLADFQVLGASAGAGGLYATSFNGLVTRHISVSGYTAGFGFYHHGVNEVTHFAPVVRSNLVGIQNTARPSYSANAIRVYGGKLVANSGWAWVENAEAASDPNLSNLASGITFENNGVNASSTAGHIYVSQTTSFSVLNCYFEDYAGTVPVNAVLIGDVLNAPNNVTLRGNMFGTSGTNVINNFNGVRVIIADNIATGSASNFVTQGTAVRRAVVIDNTAPFAASMLAGADDGADTLTDATGRINSRGVSTNGSAFVSITGFGSDLAIRTRAGGTNAAIFQNILGASVGSVSSAGAFNGSQYSVSGTKVLGARGAAVANATDAASAIARLNDLLARLRTHGIIAT